MTQDIKKRVIVGMSGGVDSSVTAALLQQQGYEVIGVTFQLLQKAEQDRSACCNLNAVNDAKKVAYKLDIPHYTLNIRDDFNEHVIAPFVAKYAAGKTPNPCVECNRHIKFEHLSKTAKELNAGHIATGHYSKITYNPTTQKYQLEKAADAHKDQSYFLYMLTADQLQSTLFPLGDFPKTKVRKMAESFNLITAHKSDSQDICFVANTYKEFVETHMQKEDTKPGLIVDTSGKVLGSHAGIHQFTIGQRKGLKLALPEPYYVVNINTETHEVTIGPKGSLRYHRLTVYPFSMVNSEETTEGQTYEIKLRYQMTPTLGKILERAHNRCQIELLTPQEFVAPGQSCVLYQGNRVAGGGIIESAVPAQN